MDLECQQLFLQLVWTTGIIIIFFFFMMGPSLSIEDHYEETNKWSKIIFANRLAELVRTTLSWTR